MPFTIYEDNGYLDVERLINLKKINFIFIIGARGIGKTYGVLKYLIKHDDARMMLIRRTVTQVELINIPEFSPLAKPASDLGFEYELKKIAKNYSKLQTLEDPPRILGYTAAMSTFSNIRGFDGSDINFIFYDEFQPERGDRVIKGEGEKFLNLYETINRNRELQGQPPVKAILASNANEIRSPILAEFGLTDVVAKMMDKKQEIYMNTNRGIAVIIPQRSPISEAKAETALYVAAESEDFKSMALNNEFIEQANVQSYPLKELKPLAAIGTMTVYLHKSRGFVYISLHRSGDCESYDTSESGTRIFKDNYYWMVPAYLGHNIIFESMRARMTFEKIFFGS